MRELTREEYEATFAEPMTDVTTSADQVVDLWEYAEPALKATFREVCSCDWNVETIYESGDGKFQHVLIPSHLADVFLVIVVNKPGKRIYGHHVLNLRVLYGLEEQ